MRPQPARPGPEPAWCRDVAGGRAGGRGHCVDGRQRRAGDGRGCARSPEARPTPSRLNPVLALPEKAVETRPAVPEMAAGRAYAPDRGREPPPSHGHPTLAVAETETPDAAVPAMMKVALAETRALPTFLVAGEAAPPTYRTLLPGPADPALRASPRHHPGRRRDPLATGRPQLRPAVRGAPGGADPAVAEQPGLARRQRPGSCSLRRSTCTPKRHERSTSAVIPAPSASPDPPPAGRFWRAARIGSAG